MPHADTYEGRCTFCGGTQKFLEPPQQALVAGQPALGWVRRCDGCHGPSVFLVTEAIQGPDTQNSTQASIR